MLLYPNYRVPIPQRPRAYTQFETYIFLIIVFVSSKLPAKLLIFIGFPLANKLLFSDFHPKAHLIPIYFVTLPSVRGEIRTNKEAFAIISR